MRAVFGSSSSSRDTRCHKRSPRNPGQRQHRPARRACRTSPSTIRLPRRDRRKRARRPRAHQLRGDLYTPTLLQYDAGGIWQQRQLPVLRNGRDLIPLAGQAALLPLCPADEFSGQELPGEDGKRFLQRCAALLARITPVPILLVEDALPRIPGGGALPLRSAIPPMPSASIIRSHACSASVRYRS